MAARLLSVERSVAAPLGVPLVNGQVTKGKLQVSTAVQEAVDNATYRQLGVAYILRNVEMPDGLDGCWLWKGPLDKRSGYGQVLRGNMRFPVGAHRFAWKMIVGPVSPKLQLDHLCGIRHCVSPLHLDPVMPREHNRRTQGGIRPAEDTAELARILWGSCEDVLAAATLINKHPQAAKL